MKSRKPEIKKSDTYVHTDITIAGEATFKKTMYVHGRSKFQGEFDVAGKSKFDNDMEVSGDLGVSGNHHIKGTLNVDDHAIFEDPVAFKKNVQIKRLTNLEEAIFNGDVIFRSKAHFNEINAGRCVFANTTIGEGLLVRGDMLTIGSYKVDKDLGVGGELGVGGNLDVFGYSILHKGLDVNGAARFHSEITLHKHVDIGGGLDVHANSIFKNNLAVNKNLTVNGDINFKIGNAATVNVDDLHAGHLVETNYLTVSKDVEISGGVNANKADFKYSVKIGDSLDICNNLRVKRAIKSESLETNAISVESDITVGGDLIVKKGMVVGDQAILTKAHISELSIINGQIKSGSYDPVIVSGYNIEFFESFTANIMQIGDVVSVSGRVNLQAGQNGEANAEISLPIETKFAAVQDLSGNAVSQDGLLVAACYANPITNRCKINYHSPHAELVAFFFNFTYRIKL